MLHKSEDCRSPFKLKMVSIFPRNLTNNLFLNAFSERLKGVVIITRILNILFIFNMPWLSSVERFYGIEIKK